MGDLLNENHAEIHLAKEYLVKGDKKKAFDLYKDLSRAEANIPMIHDNYLNLMKHNYIS